MNLEILNQWWKEEAISTELAKPYKRAVFKEVLDLLKYRQIILLSGLRRTGKSTLMYQLIEFLLKKKIDPKKILYFSFDKSIEDITEMLREYQRLTEVNWKKEKIYMILDEVQKHERWGNKIKLIYDTFPNIKIIVSGSSSVKLEKEAFSCLVGRHFSVMVNPLSFREFLDLRGRKWKKVELWADEIRAEFEIYLKRSLPEVVNWDSELLIRKYIREQVIDKIIRTDLPSKFKDVNEDLLTQLVEIFYEEPGMYLNYDNLANDLKVSKKTLVKHIFYLEFAYIIRRIRNFRSKKLTASKKLQRIYPYHWILVFGVTEAKNIYESVVASVLDANYYWREGGKEVDFVIEDEVLRPVEVKEKNKARSSDFVNLAVFAKKEKLNVGYFVYNGARSKEKINSLEINLFPLWRLCLDGKRALEK